MDDAGAGWKGQNIGTAGMTAGQWIDLAPTARPKLAPGPRGKRQDSQQNGGQDQGGGLGEDGYGGGGRSHRISLSGRAVS
jgi:hypothetical protein